MRAEQFRIFADHLRLNPQAELQSHRVHFIHKTFQSALQLFLIHEPVAEGRSVIIPVPEPSVIHDKHIDTGFFRGLCESDQDVGVEVHHSRFPVVDKNRPVLGQPPLFDEMFAVKVMEGTCHAADPAVRVYKYSLRALEGFSRSKRPGEALRMDADHAAQLSDLVNLRLRQEVSGINQAHTPDLSRSLGRLPREDRKER